MKYLFIGFLLLGIAFGHDDDNHHDDDHHHHHDHDHDNEDDDLIKDYNRGFFNLLIFKISKISGCSMSKWIFLFG